MLLRPGHACLLTSQRTQAARTRPCSHLVAAPTPRKSPVFYGKQEALRGRHLCSAAQQEELAVQAAPQKPAFDINVSASTAGQSNLFVVRDSGHRQTDRQTDRQTYGHFSVIARFIVHVHGNEKVKFLKEDLKHLFDGKGIDASAYDDVVEFRDPITNYNSLSGYLFNIQMLKQQRWRGRGAIPGRFSFTCGILGLRTGLKDERTAESNGFQSKHPTASLRLPLNSVALVRILTNALADKVSRFRMRNQYCAPK
eukprot:407557-Pelagomonas_calceolata.AAC.2